MITLYSGTPGSGKSLRAAGKILDALLAGKLVVTNFPVDLSRLRFRRLYRGRVLSLPSSDITARRMEQISSAYFGGRPKEGGILLVLDECGVVFNPRDWQHPGRRDWLTFFAQHRKLGFDCILISQTDGQLDKQIRPCIEVETKYRSVSQFLPDVISWLPFKLFVGISYYYNQPKSRVNVLRRDLFLYHRRWAKIYDTTLIFDVPSIQGAGGVSPQIGRKSAASDR